TGEVENGERLHDRAERRGTLLVRIVEEVVRREHREARPLLELDPEVQGAAVELVIGDDHRVGAHRAERSHLGLARVEVEDGSALKAVAAVEVQDARCASPLATDDVRYAGGAADIDDGVRLAEAEPGIDLAELKVVREEPRVDVGRMDERQM